MKSSTSPQCLLLIVVASFLSVSSTQCFHRQCRPARSPSPLRRQFRVVSDPLDYRIRSLVNITLFATYPSHICQ
ncbi:hypothetical protein DEU56DRAFT_439431 [Suillus clintonianus]|uniref:uncharacterized protein n=1 Tax=Suillus clintonianus TaxID=1904413 RepID=UPI001B87262E|nr:uncharacterized protein DEU56DRAFT_439431 [Suillus clintonianus]KAG2132744.1 hypothetical protein DEU56DRAFT_439431 [Suillus clintonianus]